MATSHQLSFQTQDSIINLSQVNRHISLFSFHFTIFYCKLFKNRISTFFSLWSFVVSLTCFWGFPDFSDFLHYPNFHDIPIFSKIFDPDFPSYSNLHDIPYFSKILALDFPSYPNFHPITIFCNIVDIWELDLSAHPKF